MKFTFETLLTYTYVVYMLKCRNKRSSNWGESLQRQGMASSSSYNPSTWADNWTESSKHQFMLDFFLCIRRQILYKPCYLKCFSLHSIATFHLQATLQPASSFYDVPALNKVICFVCTWKSRDLAEQSHTAKIQCFKFIETAVTKSNK